MRRRSAQHPVIVGDERYKIMHQTGFRIKASGVATSSMRCASHNPSAARKVPNPDSAEMPAPVKTTTLMLTEAAEYRFARRGFFLPHHPSWARYLGGALLISLHHRTGGRQSCKPSAHLRIIGQIDALFFM